MKKILRILEKAIDELHEIAKEINSKIDRDDGAWRVTLSDKAKK